jgi:DNA-binding GntR family transcriptional regulator
MGMRYLYTNTHAPNNTFVPAAGRFNLVNNPMPRTRPQPADRPAPPGIRRRLRQHGLTAYDKLRDLIVRGRLAPGARLIETDLAAALGVSRTPIREAIARLVQDGLALPARRSARTQVAVAPLTEGDLHDLYTIMGALEGAAARHVRVMTAADRRALAAAMTRTNEAFERIGKETPADFERLFESHNAFHAVFVERCATRRLRAMIEQVRPHIERYEYLYAGMVGPDYSDTFSEHRAMIRAIRTGSPARAEQAVRANWLNSARRLSAAVSRLPPLGDFTAQV